MRIQDIPDLEIIDLDQEASTEENRTKDNIRGSRSAGRERNPRRRSPSTGSRRRNILLDDSMEDNIDADNNIDMTGSDVDGSGMTNRAMSGGTGNGIDDSMEDNIDADSNIGMTNRGMDDGTENDIDDSAMGDGAEDDTISRPRNRTRLNKRRRKDEDTDDSVPEDSEAGDEGEDDFDEPGARKKFPINIHVVLLVVVVVTIAFILYKYLSWGQIVDPDDINTGADDYTAQSYDSILPLTDSEGNMVAPNLDDGLSIVIFGNGPFAEDRDSADGLANMLSQATGATVYNCSVSGSYLASTRPAPDMAVNPWDAFTFYWMSLFSTDLEVNDFFADAMAALGTDAPPEAAQVHDTLAALDFDTVDVIVVMYDAADYFAGRPACSTEEIPDIQSFAGNLKVGLEILKQQHPNTRIIVMSPTYAFSDRQDENGDYISSDITRYGEDVLSTYIIRASEIAADQQVSFVDNFYVTFNEDNAADYLRDYAHLNAAGRQKVIDRLVYALNYYDIMFEE